MRRPNGEARANGGLKGKAGETGGVCYKEVGAIKYTNKNDVFTRSLLGEGGTTAGPF